MHGPVRNNPALSRYEMDVEGGVAFATYRADDRTVTVTHTEVPPSLRGRGLGDELVRGTLDLIRASGRKLVPRCGFVSIFVRRHPEYHDLLG
jgi:predicted GNAT family acetyltransferase